MNFNAVILIPRLIRARTARIAEKLAQRSQQLYGNQTSAICLRAGSFLRGKGKYSGKKGKASRDYPAFDGLIFFSLVYSLKWLSSEVHLPILLISRREYRSTDDCLCNEFSKDL